MIKIESNIPLPTGRRKYNSIRTMKIGDSFLVNKATGVACVRQYLKQTDLDITLISRKINDDVWRVWRTK
tara:strand:- start:231 stop:440 length:210 start_codon:yes stop_codon:yes gene_type:complete